MGLAALIALATGVLGWLLVRLLLRPIRALEGYAAGVENGAEAPPPSHFGTRELHATGQRVIAMAEALRDREATVRSFTDHVTHELKTPVAAVRAAVELLQDGDLSPGDRALVAEIDGARVQMEAQLAALRAAAQARETRYVGQCTLDGMAAVRAEFPELDQVVAGGSVVLPLAAGGMAVVLRHLLANAMAHGARRVWLTAAPGVLEVRDDGPGISPGNAPQVFDPFFTTRRDSGGTGMGLTIVRNLLRAHRAEIVLLSAAQGAHFRITFRDG
jgi:signal transduction histidine kinase